MKGKKFKVTKAAFNHAFRIPRLVTDGSTNPGYSIPSRGNKPKCKQRFNYSSLEFQSEVHRISYVTSDLNIAVKHSSRKYFTHMKDSISTAVGWHEEQLFDQLVYKCRDEDKRPVRQTDRETEQRTKSYFLATLCPLPLLPNVVVTLDASEWCRPPCTNAQGCGSRFGIIPRLWAPVAHPLRRHHQRQRHFERRHEPPSRSIARSLQLLQPLTWPSVHLLMKTWPIIFLETKSSHGDPLVIMRIYRCAMLCSAIPEQNCRSVNYAQVILGRHYVVMISHFTRSRFSRCKEIEPRVAPYDLDPSCARRETPNVPRASPFTSSTRHRVETSNPNRSSRVIAGFRSMYFHYILKKYCYSTLISRIAIWAGKAFFVVVTKRNVQINVLLFIIYLGLPLVLFSRCFQAVFPRLSPPLSTFSFFIVGINIPDLSI